MPVNPNIALGLEPQKPSTSWARMATRSRSRTFVRQGQIQDMQMQDYTANRDIDRAAKRVDLGARAAISCMRPRRTRNSRCGARNVNDSSERGLVSERDPGDVPRRTGRRAGSLRRNLRKSGWKVDRERSPRGAQLSAVEAGRAAVAPKEQPQAPAAGGAPGDLRLLPFRSANS